MTVRKILFRILPVLFLALATTVNATNYSGWHWYRPLNPVWLNQAPTDGKYLTQNNGAHCVAMHNYNDGTHKHRLLVAANLVEQTSYNNRVYEFLDIWDAQGQEVTPWYDDANSRGMSACVAAGPNGKHVAWVQSQYPFRVCCASQALQTRSTGWDYFCYLNDPDEIGSPPDVAAATQTYGYDYEYVAHTDDPSSGSMKLYCSRSTNGGQSFTKSTIAGDNDPVQPSLGVGSPGVVYCAYQYDDWDAEPPVLDIMFEKSTNFGANWNVTETNLTPNWYDDELPCLAASGSTVFVSWTDSDGNIVYRRSTDGGSNWSSEAMAWQKSYYPGVVVLPDQVNAVLVPGGTYGSSEPYWHILLAAKVVVVDLVSGQPQLTYTALKRGMLKASGDKWNDYPVLGMSPWCLLGDFAGYCPSICGESDSYDTLAACVWSDPSRNVYVAKGRWANWHDYVDPPGQADNVGRRLFLDSDGSMLYAAGRSPYAVWGPVLGGCAVPMLADCGFRPALAVDGDGAGWLAYTRNDTVWCIAGEDGYKAVFCGSSSAVPGQPSIVCYPSAAGGSAANVVFAVYDSAGSASRIMYARVDADEVVLDTVESAGNLKDSLPSINVYKTDSLLVTWQHGTDTVFSSLLANYGPSTQGQPGAWTSPSLVTESGYHPSSVMENGSVLNCVWTQKSGDNYSISRATCDLASAAFGSWTTMATPGGSSSYEKTNPVYAGLGVSVYQQKGANGKWTIKGFVRGQGTTLVDNDTDAYHPHAVAESSAVSPSIDQVRVHLLYTAGVAFEVDSGVYDTGDVRYVCESLNVSHAKSDATKWNNGAKLVQKTGSDSLFSVYSDHDNAVVFARSANGDTWQREIVAMSRDYPAIAADSTGQHWVVAHKAGSGNQNSVQELYHFNGGMWSAETLYSASGSDTLGPASLTGASSTTTGIVYAAFRLRTTGLGGTSRIILTKSNGTTVAACTLATGAGLGDPAVAVEPYKADSDRVYVVWENSDVIWYCMDVDGRGSGIAPMWTSGGLSDLLETAEHPSVNAERDRVVAAWAQGTPAEIYARQCLSGTWQTASNLSNTANDASDYSTIAMGDTVVVAWQETRSGGADFDILAGINFGDTTLNIADNATFSKYPHVVFQNKVSGDTCIPYLHTIWSDEPSVSYYEVGYNKLNLKQSSGEGQQSASSTPIPMKPTLNACRPNPLRSHTQISYALPMAGNVSLRVYDVTGRTVRTLASGHQKAGNYSVSWDARDNRGKQVPYGVYLVTTAFFTDRNPGVSRR